MDNTDDDVVDDVLLTSMVAGGCCDVDARRVDFLPGDKDALLLLVFNLNFDLHCLERRDATLEMSPSASQYSSYILRRILSTSTPSFGAGRVNRFD